MSFFVISDGKSFQSFQTAQDHKRVGEGDVGKNTGGMGAYCPSNLINKKLEKKIINRIIKPTFKALKDLGDNYSGFLYAGLMIKENEPYLIEYNIRMGDPECQVIMPRLKSDIVKIFSNVTLNKLSSTKIEWKNKKCMTVVLCAKGYPGKYQKNIKIKNINEINLSKYDFIYHAGTKFLDNVLVSNGGRILNITSLGSNFLKIRSKILSFIKKLDLKGSFCRKDIGWKVIKK